MAWRKGWVAFGVAFALAGGAAAAETVSITYEISGSGDRAALMKRWADDFMKTHPDIKVVPVQQQDVEKNLVALTAGAGPDLIISDWNAMVSYAGNGFALPLDAFVQQDHFDLGQFFPSVLDGYRYAGHLYELPLKVDTHVLLYNRDQFDQSGVGYPVRWNWDELRTNARKLTADTNGDGQPDRFGFGSYAFYFDGFIGFIWQNGGEPYVREGGRVKSNFSDPAVEGAIQYWVDLMYKDRVMMNPTLVRDDPMFLTGKTATYFVGEWHLRQIQQAAGLLNWDIALVPYNKQKAIELGGIGYLINKASKHPQAAWEFLKYLAASDEVQKSVVASGMGLSALKRMPPLNFPGKHTEAMLASMNDLRKFDMFPEWSKIDEGIVEPLLDAVWRNQAPVKPTLQSIDARSNAVLGW